MRGKVKWNMKWNNRWWLKPQCCNSLLIKLVKSDLWILQTVRNYYSLRRECETWKHIYPGWGGGGIWAFFNLCFKTCVPQVIKNHFQRHQKMLCDCPRQNNILVAPCACQKVSNKKNGHGESGVKDLEIYIYLHQTYANTS